MLNDAIQIAHTVREWAEDLAGREKREATLAGMCAIASAKLSHLLNKKAIKNEIAMATDNTWCHVFVLVEDHIIDVTATQFANFKDQRVVVLHEKEAAGCWFHEVRYRFNDYKALRRKQRADRWPSNQIVRLK